MKKLIILSLLVTLSITAYGQSTKDSKVRIGIGAAYASEVETSGFTIKGIYKISEKFEGAATYTHFFENLGLSWDVLDFDGHFVFYDNNKKFNAYALTGVALTFWNRETIGTIIRPSETITGSYAGLNLGIGANIALSKRINLAPELRGTLFDLSYTRIGLTLQYMF